MLTVFILFICFIFIISKRTYSVEFIDPYLNCSVSFFNFSLYVFLWLRLRWQITRRCEIASVPPLPGFSISCNFDELELLSVILKIPSLSASWGFCQETIVTLQFPALATRREWLWHNRNMLLSFVLLTKFL